MIVKNIKHIRNKITLCILSLFIITSTIQIPAQENPQKVLVIGEKVGDEIDREEREKYGLFPVVEHFVSAKFIQAGSGDIVLQIVIEKDGKPIR